MKALLMKRTPAIALACALAATAAIGVGVAQANAADVEAADNVALEERIDGEVKDDGVYLKVDDQAEEPEGNIAEAADEEATEETDDLASVGITDDGIENEATTNATEEADDTETDAVENAPTNVEAVDDEAEETSDAEAKLVAGKKTEKQSSKSNASASASNVTEDVENEYIEVEERAPEDLDEADAEASSSVSHYIDEDEPAENIVELPAE